MEEISSINWELLLPIIIIQFVLMVIALIDVIRAKETNGPKALWIVLVLFISLLGPIAYFIFGRKK
jgi:hypothetical protein